MLGEPPAMRGPVRSVLGQQPDRGIGVFSLPAWPERLEPVTQKLRAPRGPVAFLAAADDETTDQQSRGDHGRDEVAYHKHRRETSLSANQPGDLLAEKS